MSHFDPADRDLEAQHDAAALELIVIAGPERAAAWMADPRSFTRATCGLSRDLARMADYFLVLICNRRQEASSNRGTRERTASGRLSQEVRDMLRCAAEDDARRAAAAGRARMAEE